jgi:hypothetical protein
MMVVEGLLLLVELLRYLCKGLGRPLLLFALCIPLPCVLEPASLAVIPDFVGLVDSNGSAFCGLIEKVEYAIFNDW